RGRRGPGTALTRAQRRPPLHRSGAPGSSSLRSVDGLVVAQPVLREDPVSVGGTTGAVARVMGVLLALVELHDGEVVDAGAVGRAEAEPDVLLVAAVAGAADVGEPGREARRSQGRSGPEDPRVEDLDLQEPVVPVTRRLGARVDGLPRLVGHRLVPAGRGA